MRRDFAYYPGCLAAGPDAGYGLSVEGVFRHLGYTLEELPDWTCCGQTSARAVAPGAALSLGLHNLSIAASLGKPVVTPCPVCLGNLNAARLAAAKGDTQLPVGLPVPAESLAAVEVVGPLEVLSSRDALLNISAKRVEPLSGFHVACYYGCRLSKGAGDAADGIEDPLAMERILEVLGAEVVDWSWKRECCGAALALPAEDIVLDLAGRILSAATDAGADCIAVACPLCHENLDLRQFDISKRLRRKVEVPVFYFTELMAIAFDLGGTEKWLKKHLTTVFPLVDKLLDYE